MKNVRDNIKPILALIIVISGIAFIFFNTFIPPKNPDSQGLIAMISFMQLAFGYYLGTSTGQSKKDETIQKLSEKNNINV